MSGTVNSALPLSLVVLPAVCGALLMIVPKKSNPLWAAILAAIALAQALFAPAPGQSLEFTRAWAGWGMDFSLKLTGQNGPLLVAASALTLLAAAYAALPKRSQPGKPFGACMLLALAMASGALLANNLVAMLFFWQALWAPLFLMIKAGGESAWRTSVKAVFTAGLSDLCLMLGMGLAGLAAGGLAMDQMRIPMDGLGAAAFLLMALGAVSKLGAMPFHGWILDAADGAPTPFLALVPGALNLLLGASLLSRLTGMFEYRVGSAAGLILAIAGAGTMLLSAPLALVAGSPKRLAASLLVSLSGAMVLTAGLGRAADGALAVLLIPGAAAALWMFLAAGALEETPDPAQPKAPLFKRMPAASLGFLLTAAAVCTILAACPIRRIAVSGDDRSVPLVILGLAGAILVAAAVLRFALCAIFGKFSRSACEWAPALGGILDLAERTKFDPYPAAGAALRAYSNACLKINDAISWFYDVAMVRCVGFLSHLVRSAHNGSQSRYVLWALAGAAIVVILYALS